MAWHRVNPEHGPGWDECGVGWAGEDSHPGAALPCHEAESLQPPLINRYCPARGAELSMAQGWGALPDAGTPHKSRGINCK